jgi:hypothetical protein
MQFRTKIQLPVKTPKIDYQSKILMIGSCFVENIGDKLDYYKLQNLRNPFGILFHPEAIENFIRRSINADIYSPEDVFYHNERWHSFDAHSSLSDSIQEELLKKLNQNLKINRNYLLEASHIVITLGTAWVYKNIETGKPVANCHKLPQKYFSKELLSLAEIEGSLHSLISELKIINPELTIIFTLSPVRHLKDGFVENQISKAHLIAALHKVINENNSVINYFPVYEIMMDELRDYRFYAEDMLHPNVIAIDYIWEKFVEVWFSSEAYSTLKLVESIQKSLAHRPFDKRSNSHQAFSRKLQVKIEDLKKEIPHIHF